MMVKANHPRVIVTNVHSEAGWWSTNLMSTLTIVQGKCLVVIGFCIGAAYGVGAWSTIRVTVTIGHREEDW